MIPPSRDMISRYATAYRDLLTELNDLYLKGGTTRESAVAAFDIHREQFDNVIELISPCVEEDKNIATIAMTLPRVGGAIINFRLHWEDRIRWSSLALAAARFVDDRLRIAKNANDLGAAYTAARQYDQADRHLDIALTEAIALPDLDTEAAARGNTANLKIRMEQPHDAIPHLRRIAEIYRQTHDRRLPDALNSLSIALKDVDDLNEALQVAQDAHDAATDSSGRARALNSRGISLRLLGRAVEAEEAYRAARDLFRDAGDVNGEADVLANLSLLFEKTDGGLAQQFATDALMLRIKHKLGNTEKLVERLQRLRGDELP